MFCFTELHRISQVNSLTTAHEVIVTASCDNRQLAAVSPIKRESSPAGFEPTRLSAVDFKSTPLTTRAKRHLVMGCYFLLYAYTLT